MRDNPRQNKPAFTAIDFGKVPPQAVDLEESVLGTILSYHNSIYDIADLFTPDAFYTNEHQIIAQAILTLFDANKKIDLLVVTEELRRLKQLDEVGGPLYVTQLLSKGVVASHILQHYQIVFQKYIQREIIRDTSEKQAMAFDESIDLDELIEGLNKGVDDINEKVAGKKQASHISSLVKKSREALKKREQAAKNNKITGIKGPLIELDKLTQGFQPGVYTIAARPGQGKTAVSLSIGKSAAVDGHPCCFYSLEMDAVRLADRLIMGEADIPENNFRTGYMAVKDWIEFDKATERLSKLPIYIDDNPIVGTRYIKSHARTMQKRGLCDIIIIDYLQLADMDSYGKDNREREVAKTMREFKIISKQLQIPVIVLSQLNRVIEGRDKRPNLTNLRECLSVETTLIYTKNSIENNSNSLNKILSLDKIKIKAMDSINVPKEKNIVYRLKTAMGRFIDCTLDHPILTSDGYKKLRDITTDDAVALACDWEFEGGNYIEESRFIGWMIGNGYSNGYASPELTFNKNDTVVIKDCLEFMSRRFGYNTPKYHRHWSDSVVQLTFTFQKFGDNPVKTWLREYDLWGKTAKDKVIPDWFLEKADRKSVIELIQGLYETDGSIAIGKGKGVIQYSTSSLLLSQQLIFLLAKLGIIANLCDGFTSKKATTPNYKIVIQSSDFIRKFIDVINLRGLKAEKITRLNVNNMVSKYGNRLGKNTCIEIHSILRNNGLKKYRLSIHKGSRSSKSEIIKLLKIPECSKILNKYSWLISDHIYWDSIDSINIMGETAIFDRTVPKTHNFIANGIIVHNSGAIEQDSDCVIFIHRPSYYGIDKDRDGNLWEGVGLLIVAKNREGPIADVRFSHNPSITKIKDWVNPNQFGNQPASNRDRQLPPEKDDIEPDIQPDLPF